ncbi:MAG: GNAT family N-acetyltransferase [Myxococcota bacterium]
MVCSGWIQSVHIALAWRRRGIYRALHEAVVARARAAGAVGIRLYVAASNDRAQTTYAALGMVETHYRLYEQEL